MIEPGEQLVRLILEAADGMKAQEQALKAFEEAHDEAFQQFRKDLSAELPNVWRMEVPHQRHRPRPADGAGRQTA